MNVLGDAIARDRRSDATALVAPAVGRRYDYRRFCTSAWKAGNFLRHIGVRGGAGVAIADDPLPEPVLTLYAAASLGAPSPRLGHREDPVEDRPVREEPVRLLMMLCRIECQGCGCASRE